MLTQKLETLRTHFLTEKVKIETLLSPETSYEKVIETVLLLVSQNEELQKCDPRSIVEAVLEALQLGLDFSVPNEANLVPFRNKAVLIAGYKGLLKMARRRGNTPKDTDVVEDDARPVYSKDYFELHLGTEKRIIHRPNPFGDRGELIGFYAYARLRNGEIKVETMSVDEVTSHMKRFLKSTKGPFADPNNFVAYGRKTVIRLLCWRQLNLRPEVAWMLRRENSIDGDDLDEAIPAEFSEVVEPSSQEEREELIRELGELTTISNALAITPIIGPVQIKQGMSTDELREIIAERFDKILGYVEDLYRKAGRHIPHGFDRAIHRRAKHLKRLLDVLHEDKDKKE